MIKLSRFIDETVSLLQLFAGNEALGPTTEQLLLIGTFYYPQNIY